MNNYLFDPNDFDEFDDINHRNSLPAPVKAAAIGSIGVLIIHGITYFTAGLGIIISIILFTLLYLLVGLLGAFFSSEQNIGDDFVRVGGLSGFILWIISVIVNLIAAIIFGGVSLGIGFLFSVPYSCLCGISELVMGTFFAMVGGVVYGLFWGGSHKDDDEELYGY